MLEFKSPPIQRESGRKYRENIFNKDGQYQKALLQCLGVYFSEFCHPDFVRPLSSVLRPDTDIPLCEMVLNGDVLSPPYIFPHNSDVYPTQSKMMC